MADLQASHFREFFQKLYEKQPFPWQEGLAEQVCTDEWPEVIHLPTASGKTACLDIALFALAVRGSEAARRIFFVVDRRVVVNEAYLRMCEVQGALKKAESGVLREVAERFRQMAGSGEDQAPLLVSEMRGGAFRDESWVKNPLQPTVIASTVDQVGSRLLFRGYGVNENSWPLHAGLIGNDALIFLDEAHCSRAFAQTLKRVEKYRGAEWASQPIPTPFHFVEMTATPSQKAKPEKIFTLTENDRKVDALQKRLQAVKPTRLIEIKGRKDDTAKLAEELVKQAGELAKSVEAKRIAIFANRVKTAKQAYKRLQLRMEGSDAQAELVIGSMRAVDRDDLHETKLKKLKSGAKRDGPITFVVSTQCLEVGADFDFDVLVSECASIDALQQRFGRLDRLGEFEHARGAIVIGSWQANPKQPDAVYGDALSKTWEWLKQLAGESGEVNMGIEHHAGEPLTVNEHLKELDELDAENAKDLRLIGEDAPVLLPAHLDMLAQTSPPPAPSPLVELFLHGPKCGVADVQVVWRSDLEDAQIVDEEIEIVELCPPSTRETMSVSINTFRRWFAGERDINEKESDLEIGIEEDSPEQRRKEKIYALAWDGEKSKRIWNTKQVRPGQTLILKESMGGWNELGYIPDGAPIDAGDRAAFEVRNSISLRLHPELTKRWPESPALQSLSEDLRQPDVKWEELKIRLQSYREQLKAARGEATEKKPPLWPYKILDALGELRRPQLDVYPGQKIFYALRARQGKARQKNGEQVLLKEHLEHVEVEVEKMASAIPENLHDALRTSARLHDYGKVDVRYQAWLRGGDRMAARFTPKPVAKSGNDTLQKQETAGLPKGFRHELLSLMFAERSPGARGPTQDLILHLVAAHHGRCRPLAPVILDEGAECVLYDGISVCGKDRHENAPHRLDSGVADRFWRLTAEYGWWGLAYLEALLRLADWQASEEEAAEVSD